MFEKSLHLKVKGFSRVNGAFNYALFKTNAWASLGQHQPPASGEGQSQQENGERETSDSSIAQKIKAIPFTVTQTFQCRSKAKFDEQQRRNQSRAQSVLAKNYRIAAHQVHDLEVLCKMVGEIKGSPEAQWTDLWVKSERNGVRLLFLHQLQDSYLKKVAGLDDTLLDEAFSAIEHVRAFADSRMRAEKMDVLAFDQELVQRGLIALRRLHEAASLWAANASVPVPEVGDLVFKGRLSSHGREAPVGCNFSIVIKRFNNSSRVLVEFRHANTKDGSFGHRCFIAANAEEQRGLKKMEDPVQDKTITNKLMQMRRARQPAGHGQEASSTQNNTQGERVLKRKRDRLDPRYVATLKEALDQSLVTRDALQIFREKWGQTDADWRAMPGEKPVSFPDDKQLKTKLASMKRALKKQRPRG